MAASESHSFPLLVIIAIIGLILVAGLFYALSQSARTSPAVNIETTPTPSSMTETSFPEDAETDIVEPPADWQTYTGPDYTFNYPAGLETDPNAAGTGVESTRVRFMGSKQVASGRTQTSIFDGYSFVVTKVGTADRIPDAWAKERRATTAENCPDITLSEVEAVTLGQASGVQYTVRNCMADHTNSFISANGYVYEVTELYVGEPADQAGYEEITNQIFNSLRFQ